MLLLSPFPTDGLKSVASANSSFLFLLTSFLCNLTFFYIDSPLILTTAFTWDFAIKFLTTRLLIFLLWRSTEFSTYVRSSPLRRLPSWKGRIPSEIPGWMRLKSNRKTQVPLKSRLFFCDTLPGRNFYYLNFCYRYFFAPSVPSSRISRLNDFTFCKIMFGYILLSIFSDCRWLTVPFLFLYLGFYHRKSLSIVADCPKSPAPEDIPVIYLNLLSTPSVTPCSFFIIFFHLYLPSSSNSTGLNCLKFNVKWDSAFCIYLRSLQKLKQIFILSSVFSLGQSFYFLTALICTIPTHSHFTSLPAKSNSVRSNQFLRLVP